MSAFEELQDLSTPSLVKLNDMLRHLFRTVQGGITRTELSDDLLEEIDTVDGEKLEEGAVTGDKIGDEAIASYHVQEAAIGTAHIQQAAITTALIEDAAITNAKIGDAEIDNAKIADLAVTGAKIANATIENSNIKNATIEHGKIASLDASKITTGSLSADYISGGTINGTNVNVVNLKASEITVGKINGAQIDDYTIKMTNIDQTTNFMHITVGSGKDYPTIQAAIDSLPNLIMHMVRIEVYAGMYLENVVVQKFNGIGSIEIEAHTGDTVDVRSFYIVYNDPALRVSIINITITNTEYDAIIVMDSPFAFEGLTIAATSAYSGISVTSGNGYIAYCTISNKGRAIYANFESYVSVFGCTGSGNTEGINCTLAILIDGGDNTIAATAPLITAEGGIIVPPQGLQASGDQNRMITGAPGTANNLLVWNADGDAVDSGKKASDFAATNHTHSWLSITAGVDGGETLNISAASSAKELCCVFRKSSGYYLPLVTPMNCANLAIGGLLADNTRASFIVNKSTWVLSNTSPAGTMLAYLYYR